MQVEELVSNRETDERSHAERERDIARRQEQLEQEKRELEKQKQLLIDQCEKQSGVAKEKQLSHVPPWVVHPDARRDSSDGHPGWPSPSPRSRSITTATVSPRTAGGTSCKARRETCAGDGCYAARG